MVAISMGHVHLGYLSKAALTHDTARNMEPVRIDRHMADGETLLIAGGLHVVHTPVTARDRSPFFGRASDY
jgi:hypothetical protein